MSKKAVAKLRAEFWRRTGSLPTLGELRRLKKNSRLPLRARVPYAELSKQNVKLWPKGM